MPAKCQQPTQLALESTIAASFASQPRKQGNQSGDVHSEHHAVHGGLTARGKHVVVALEEGLENFAGCAVVISHDRWFLDRICTHILAFEGDSQVYFFEGGFSDYEENKKKRLGGDLMPKRIKYKKLVR